MEPPHWTWIAFYILALPALVYWIVVHVFHVHDPSAKEVIGGFVGLATLIYAVHKLG